MNGPLPSVPVPLRFAVRWLLPSLLVALASGLSSGFFLWALDLATTTRLAHPWLLWLLPVAGLASGWIYHRFGGTSEAGNNLVLSEASDPTTPLPTRMAPLVLGGTLATHLFGGSAGREGTAIQMAAALSDRIAAPFRMTRIERGLLLRAAIAGGFAAVFGTPLAGTLFGLEVALSGGFTLTALFPCLVSAILADRVVSLLPVSHTHYPIGTVDSGFWPLLACGLFGILAGLVARAFAASTRVIAARLRAHVDWPPLRPALGGLAVVALGTLVGPRWLGLGVPEIVEGFAKSASILDPALKLLYTAVTVGSGFKGGEVTPLFYIGSTLGSCLAPLLDLPVATLAGVGFVAVFAGATNTPLACTVMAIELFGAPMAPLAAIACTTAWLSSGPRGIYTAQRHRGDKGTVSSALGEEILQRGLEPGVSPEEPRVEEGAR